MKTNLKLITTSILLCLFSNTILAQAQWETDYLRKLEDRRSQGKNDFYNSVSTSVYLFSIAAPLTYLTTGIIKKDKTIRKQGLYLVESIGGATFISYATKNIVKRERPAIQDTTLNPVNEALNYSFPSGHTSAAFSLATSLTIMHPKWYVIVPAFSYAAIAGYSRMYLGVHYPSDVIVGALVGSGSAWLCYRLNKWMRQPKSTKVKNAPAM